MDIDFLLKLWGAWAAGGLNLDVKPLVMFHDGTEAGGRDRMNDDEAQLFDPAVAMLKLIDKELWDVVRLHYVYGLSLAAIGRMKRVNSKEIYNKRAAAQYFVLGHLYGSENAGDLMASRPRF